MYIPPLNVTNLVLSLSPSLCSLLLSLFSLYLLQVSPVLELYIADVQLLSYLELVTLCVVFTVFTGSSAVTPVFVQKGKDVTLDVMKDDFHVDDIVLWRFNKNSIFVRFVPGKEPIVSEVYTGRVEFPQKKYSVTLKNLQESDSGVYTAQLIGSAEVQTVAEHKLTVSSSSDSCNLTVTCSTQDSDITSRVTCDTITCHQEGGESSKVMTSGASLRLYLVNSMINCNHSNQVSWTKDTKETGQACLLPPGKNQRQNNQLAVMYSLEHVVIVPVLFGISVLILVFVLFLCYRRRRQWQCKCEHFNIIPK
uniref:Immunoglobulin V-set domain-containing protein n=1 Tax=Mastacembelus armatus TaxID=205130 RepID=A0A7N8X6R3_9TELE